MVIDHMVIGKGRTEGVSRDEQNRNKEDKKIRDIGGFGGLGVGSEVKDGTGLNTGSR